jgi:hypothetical protein
VASPSGERRAHFDEFRVAVVLLQPLPQAVLHSAAARPIWIGKNWVPPATAMIAIQGNSKHDSL